MVWEKQPISMMSGYNSFSPLTATVLTDAWSTITAKRLFDVTLYSVEITERSSLATSSPFSDFAKSCMHTRRC